MEIGEHDFCEHCFKRQYVLRSAVDHFMVSIIVPIIIIIIITWLLYLLDTSYSFVMVVCWVNGIH